MKIKAIYKGKHVNYNRLRRLRIAAVVLIIAEALLIGYGISGCTAESEESEISMTADLRARGGDVIISKNGDTMIKAKYDDDGIHKPYTSSPYYEKILEAARSRTIRSEIAVNQDQPKEVKQPIDPSTIKTYPDNGMEESIKLMEESVALTWEEMHSEEYLANLKATNLPEYLALLPWTATKPENVWVDTSDKSQDDPDWLPGLKVSRITADMMKIPDWMTEEEFKHVVTMLANECGNAENDEVFMYTGGVLMNRIWYDTYFVDKYGGIDGQLTAPGQYTGLYVQEAAYQKATQMKCFDTILRNAYLVVNGYYNMPKNVSFQAEFVQGKGCWKAIHIATDYWSATEYFCYTLTKID